ncbi:hypothetical protein [Paenibacillus ehimensis]|uniref:hypothetical protein n=1 Tax=Paenibacillus ehimensis TaxID=79264 RepID=UPI000FDAB3BD|nr:hypothetical protein [Paenibacillus ehimensis]
MFWKKKKMANELSVSALFVQVATLSYDIHDKAIEVDQDNKFLDGRHEKLFRHIVAASAMTAIAKLEDPIYADYYEQLMTKLNEKYEGTHELSLHFNDVLREQYQIDDSGKENLPELIAYWLYFNVAND